MTIVTRMTLSVKVVVGKNDKKSREIWMEERP
jgi:hypothetical protein